MADDLVRLDSRCLGTRKGLGSIRTPFGNASLVYCLNCGSPHKRGIVPEDTLYVRYICTDCNTKLTDDAKRTLGLIAIVPGTEAT
jgi:transposase-like protein